MFDHYSPLNVSTTLFLLLLLLLPFPAKADTVKLNVLKAKMESDSIEFARKVEALNQDRGTFALLNCSRNNYDDCVAQFPSPTCYKSDELFISKCSTSLNDTCAALYNFTVASVRLPSAIADGPDGNPTDPQVSPVSQGEKVGDTCFRDEFSTHDTSPSTRLLRVSATPNPWMLTFKRSDNKTPPSGHIMV